MVLEKSLPKTQERNYGIDLLRIVAMFMVLFLHILGNGGILFEVEPLSPHGIAAWFFEMATFSAINCYGIISGYVGINSKHKYSSIVMLWLQVVFYCVLITLFFHLKYPDYIALSQVGEAFFPICTQKYWYATSYVGLFFLMPALNGVKYLPKKDFKIMLIALFCALSVLPTVFSRDIFTTGWGYSMLWLSFLYLVGAYVKLHGFFKNSIRFSLILYFAATVISHGVKLFEESVSDMGKYADLATGLVAQYTSPAMLISGLSLFVVFSQIKPPAIFRKIIKIVAPCTFGVYIIHAHPLMWDRVIHYRYAHFLNYNPLVMMLLVFLAALVMFICFAAIDFIRLSLFKLLRIRKLLEKAEERL